MSKIVIAIGGNALGSTPIEQLEIVKQTAKQLVNFVEKKNELIIVHGNGPQVGMINNGFDIAHLNNEESPIVDFPECGAMSQGYIGYHLQQALKNELRHKKINKDVASIITQVIVDKQDPGFKNPTKPIGSFMSLEKANELSKSKGWNIVEDSGRGWRRVIASPVPVDIIEKDMILKLVENKFLVICCGGGGVPVIEDKSQYTGIAAVIDKDFAAAKVAEVINADMLIILTAVDRVAINFNKDNQKELDVLTKDLINKYIDEGQFGSGSMLPKIKAALSFVERTKGKKAYIGSLKKAIDVLEEKSGTKIIL
ncbi:carbamate kinase [Spiroplasma endosymbiont of Aspidapion aeneum]|uniref:carbamate kinase n=1 Tax=Spiroplasma endosymbiont of Aspidapion aeneum TaxID=3066276 RepID=UPI00313E431E